MIVITDTSPLNYLILIGEIGILPSLYKQVVVPAGVVAELMDVRSPEIVRRWSEQLPDWVEVRDPAAVDETLLLDPGESAAISLALELGADLLLVDDRAAATVASTRGLQTIGTLGIIIRAAQSNLLDGNAALVALESKTSFRASRSLLDAVRKQLLR